MSFKLWLSGLFTRKKKPVRRTKRRDSVFLQLEQLEDRLVPSTITVTTSSDTTIHTGISLRDAIVTANSDASSGISDTIVFSSSLNGNTIGVSQGVLELSGAGGGSITINGGNEITVSGSMLTSTPIFKIDSGVTAAFSGLTIENCFDSGGNGGGIANAGTLTVTGSTITGNNALAGGGIYNTGTLTVNNSAISSNFATYGGGIDSSGTLTVASTTLSFNSGMQDGGAIYSTGNATIYSSTISNNMASSGPGGGIYTSGTATVSDSTLTSNMTMSGVGGGGIDNAGTLTVTNSTISANMATGTSEQGGGIYSSSTLVLLNSIVAGNTAGGSDVDVDGTVSGSGASGGNLIGNGTGMSGISNSDSYGDKVGTSGSPISAGLGSLQNNGGPTYTMALSSSSPALSDGVAITTVSASYNTSVTTIDVGNAAAIASTPGQYYILIDGEEMEVTSVNLSSNSLAVVRDINGTSSSLNSGDSVYLFADQRGQVRSNPTDMGAYSHGAPVVTADSPNGGSTAGGTSVTITGMNFTGATAVKFGSTNATTFTVNSSTQITATAPSGSAGSVDITVTTGYGTSTTSSSDQFSYVGAPTVTSISPTAGPTTGGTSVVITGTNFVGVTAVKFGSSFASTFTVNSSTQITATAPSGSPSTVDITVSAGGGTSSTSSSDQYTFAAAPMISMISPTAGPTAGGTSVTITGTNFLDVTAVKFGSINATSFTVNSSTQITAVTPSGSTGTVTVSVTAAGGTASGSTFQYVAAPTVTGVSPVAGPTAGGTNVVITGTNFNGFSGTVSVSFGGTAATSVTVNSSTQITATAPAESTGTVNITVTTPGGTSATSSSDQYTFAVAPTVTAVSPSAGSTNGGNSVTITGTSFVGVTGVKFGSSYASSYTVNSATQITVTLPSGSAGTVDITVIAAGGTSSTSSSDHFTYVSPPTVSSISPGGCPTSGGTTVTITGINFTGATAVNFGSVPATSFTVNSSTQITATAPADSAGMVNVTVTTVGGTSTAGMGQFTYVAAPTVTGISPALGPTSGMGMSVVITGTNFSVYGGVSAVYFGSTAASYFSVNSPTQITVTAPAESAGTVNITVTTLGGTSATSSSDQYTYEAAPTITSVSPSSGPTTGGTSVIITGTNFTGASLVDFGSTSASFTVNSPTQITATSPSESQGTVNVEVVTPGGFTSASSSDQFTFEMPTTTSLTSSVNPSVYGQSTTFTATVTSTMGPPMGTVEFLDGTTVLGTATLSFSGSGDTASFSTSALAAGNHSNVTAVYEGNVSYYTSTSSNYDQVVNQANTTTTITASPTSSVYGQTVTLTASVSASSPGSGTPTGTVTFYDGSTSLGSVSLSSGSATLNTTVLTVGNHTNITAVYNGDSNFVTSTSSVASVNVSQDNSTTTLTTLTSPTVYGQSVTFTATLTANSPGSGTPSGSVTFYDGSMSLATISLNGSGVATLSTSSLAVGNHPTITAVFNGSTNFITSTSSDLDQLVNQDGSTTTVGSSANPSVVGQNVTFTATVSASSPGSGTPTGTVQFLVDGVDYGSAVSLSTGQASISDSALSLGSHTIMAVYTGDSNFTASNDTASPLSQTVDQASTTTTLSSSINPTVFGQSTTFTATVLASSPGSGTPTGSVSFYDGTTLLGTGTLSSGQATFSIAGLATGNLTITAVYIGDSSFTGSTSGSVDQSVQQDGTTTTLSGNPSSTVYSAPVVLTATVGANSPGSGTPTGNVAFYDSGSYLGSAALNGSDVATLTLTNLTVGDHPSITARYVGDSNFTSSTSSGIDESISQDGTTTILVSSVNPSSPGQSVTFTATISANSPGLGTPTGTVQFVVDGVNYGSPVSLSSGQASIGDAGLSLGYHTIAAVYSGDTSFTTSDDTAAPLSQEVVAAPSVTTNPANQSIVYSQNTTFTAAATGFPVPSVQWEVSTDGGTTFYPLPDGGMYSGVTTGTLTVDGATVAMSGYEYVAVFTNNLGTATTTPATLIVSTNSAVSIASSGSPSVVGQEVTFTATVAAVLSGAGTPTGTVSFFDGSTLLGEGVLNSSGQASFSTWALALGDHPSITAVYSGDANFVGSTSADFDQVIESALDFTSIANGNWQSASTWMGGETGHTYPIAGDTVLITNGFDVTIPDGESDAAANVTLQDDGSALTLANSSAQLTVASIAQTGGTVNGAGSLTITSQLTWTGGMMSGSGTTVVSLGATMQLGTSGDSATAETLDGWTLDNYGVGTWVGGQVAQIDGSEFHNEVTGSITIDASGTWAAAAWNSDGTWGSASTGLFVNDGAVMESAGAGDTVFSVAFDNTSDGTVEVGSETVSGTPVGPSLQLAGTVSDSGTWIVGSGTSGTNVAQLIFSGGGTSDDGSFSVASDGQVAFAGGTFALSNFTLPVSWSGQLSVTAGTLNLGSNLTVFSYQQSGGILDLGADLTATDCSQSGGIFSNTGSNDVTISVLTSLVWTGGTMSNTGSGSGTTLLGNATDATSTLQLGASGNAFGAETLDGWTLANYGAGSWAGGQVAIIDGGSFDNEATGTLTLSTAGGWEAASWNENESGTSGSWSSTTSTGSFTNQGTITLPATTGTVVFTVAFTNNSSGAVNVDSGTVDGTAIGCTLNLAGTVTDSGSWTIGSGTGGTDVASVSFSGDGTTGGFFTLAEDGAVIVSNGNLTVAGAEEFGSGQISLTGGTMTLDSDFSVYVFTQSGGTLTNGSDDTTPTLTVFQSLLWTGGSVVGTGTTQSYGTLQLGSTSSSSEVLDGWTFDNDGVGTWAEGAFYQTDGSTFDNQLGGSLTMESSGGWYTPSSMSSSGPSTLSNEGFIAVSASGGASWIGEAFNNAGSVEVLAGTLILQGGGTEDGDFYVPAGSTLGFDGAVAITTFDPSSSVTGNGTVEISTGTLNIAGAFDFAGLTLVQGGTINFQAGADLSALGTLQISSGSASFNTGNQDTLAALTLTGGALTGSDEVMVNGQLLWTGGDISGTGTIDAEGSLQLGSAGDSDDVLTLDGWTLNNDYLATWAGGGAIYQINGSVFNNQAEAGLIIDNSDGWYTPTSLSSTAPGSFNNYGSVTIVTGGGTSWFGVAFNNAGSVQVKNGTLSLQGGGSDDGSFAIGAGATLSFGGTGTTSLTADSDISGVGTVEFAGGSVSEAGTLNLSGNIIMDGGSLAVTSGAGVQTIGSLNVSGGSASFASGQDVNIATLDLSGGTLSGSDTLTVSGPLTWTGGTISGAGTLNSVGGFQIGLSSDSDDIETLAGWTINDASVGVWAGGGAFYETSGAFNIETGASLDVQNADGWSVPTGTTGSGTFNNSGTLTVTAGTGTSWFGVPFNNAGSVQVLTGTLSLQGGGSDNGSFIVSPGATLAFAGSGTTTLTSTSDVSGAGTLAFNGGTIDEEGTYSVSGDTLVSGGTVDFASGVSVQVMGSLTITSGTVDFSTGSTVATSALSISSGTLSGSDTLTVTSSYVYIGGTVTVNLIVPGTAPVVTAGQVLDAATGQELSGTLGSFIDDGDGPYDVTINWGDGSSTTSGDYESNGDGGYDITGEHTYGSEGTFIVTVTASDADGNSTAAIDTAIVADSVNASAVSNISASVGQALRNQVVATFTDRGTTQPVGDYSATINWGDGTTSPGTIHFDSATGTFSVVSSHTYGSVGTNTITVTIGHQSAPTVQVTDNVNAGLTGAGSTLIAIAGTSTGNVTLATFSPAGSLNVDDYAATVNWGDGTSSGTGDVTYDSATGLFTVSGAHTYAATGAESVSIVVTYNSVPTTFTTSAQVDGMPVIVTGLAVNAAAGAALTVPVATFVDPNGAGSVSSYNAFIDWGDGGTSTGTITSNGSGTFTVTGSYSYSTANSYTIAVTVVDADDNSGTASSAATIGTPVLTAGIDDLQADQNNTVSGVIASFTDTNSAATLGNFSASINWGDGHTSAGTIVEDASGDFGVEASHTYAADGAYTFTVTITDNLDNNTTASATATVGESTVSVSALNLAPTARFAFNGTVANFSDAGPWTETDDFTALINWGDGSAESEGTIVDNGDGTFGVEGTHTYATAGSFPISVTVTDDADESGTGTSTAKVTALSMTPDPDTLILAQTESFLGTVITFDSDSGLTDPTPFSATINWGDGTSSTGSDVTIVAAPNGGFDVQGSHTYTTAGSYTISVSLTDTNGDDFTGQSTASVQTGNLAITPTANLVAAVNQPFSGDIASFDDVNSTGDPTVYDATINWGDGTSSQPDTSTGNVLLNDDGSFDIAGDHTYTTSGTYTVTVTLTDASGDTVTSSTTIAVQASPIAVTLASVAPTQQQEFSDVVATFTQIDPDATDFSATISWGDGHTTTGSVVANDDGSFSVYGDNTYASSGSFTWSVTVSDNDTPQNSVTASGTITVVAGSAPAAPDITANEMSAATGIATSSTQPIAWFKDPSGDTNPADFSVVVAWGDGSSSTLTSSDLTSDGSGGFNVFASHTYESVADDTYTITVTNTTGESPAFSESTTGDFLVSPAVLTVQSDPLSLAPGQAFSGEVATFSDINDVAAAGSYSSIIEWGDGQTSAGTIVANGSGGFSVQGSHSYAEPGTYQVATLVFGGDGYSGSGTGSAVVAVRLTALGTSPQAVQNQSFTGTLATFSGPSTSAGAYTVSIDWGNGDISAGTVVANGSGFEVEGSETYAESGSFTATVTISDSAGDQTTANAAVNVAPAPLVASGDLLLTGAARLAFTQTVAYFTPADPSATAGNFQATINWGDGSTSTSTGSDVAIVPDANGGFDVNGTHAYTAVGSYTVSVTIIDPAGNTATVTSTVNVVTASIAASGSDFSATAGVAYDDFLATFTSTNPSAQKSDFTAEITWNDSGESSATTTGTIVDNGDGSFSVEGDYTYASPGTYPVTVSITGPASTSAEVTETATVSTISVEGYSLNLGTNLAFNDTVAYFQTALTATLTASINWGDGTTTDGNIVADPAGGFDVQGSHTYTTAGSYSAVVTVSNPSDTAETGSDTTDITVAAAQLSVNAVSITPVENQSFTGVVATFTAGADAKPGDFSATIDWGDGSTPTTIGFGSGDTAPNIVVDPNGGFDVIGTHTYANMDSHTLTVTVNDTAGDASSSDTATMQTVPLNVVGSNLILQQSQTFSGIVGTIQDADASLTAGTFDVVVTWGDGSSSEDVTLVPGSTSGVFDVEASHVYSSAGQYQPTISVIDGDGNIQVGYGSAFVSPDYLSVVAATPTAGQGQSTTLLLATVTDPGVTGLSAEINWGSGASVAGNIVDNGDGTFSVMGKYSFAALGTQAVTVTVSAGSTSETVTSDVDVVAATLTAAPVDSGAVVNLAFTNQSLATFLAASSSDTTADFSATINWGDGSAAGTGTIVENADGSFSVEAGHTYAAIGTYSVAVTIQGPNSASATTTATIQAAAIQITAGLENETGETIDGTIARFWSSDSSASADDFTPIVTWGDGRTSEDATVVADPNGGFDVQASYVYATAGQYPVQVTVVDRSDNVISCKALMQVTQDNMIVTGTSVTDQEGVAFSARLATVYDPDVQSASGLTAVSRWSDGTTTTDSISTISANTFAITGGETPLGSGKTLCSVIVTDPMGQTGQVCDPVDTASAIVVTNPALEFTVTAGASLSLSENSFAFADARSTGVAWNYTASINWGDNSPVSNGTVILQSNGTYTVAATHSYAQCGPLVVAITITNTVTEDSTTIQVPVNVTAAISTRWQGGNIVNQADWDNGANWSNGAPTSSSNVLIVGATVNLTAANVVVNTIDFSGGGSLNINGVLTINGFSQVAGQLNVGSVGNKGTLKLGPGANVVVSGGGSFALGDVQMGNNAQLTLDGAAGTIYGANSGFLFGGTVAVAQQVVLAVIGTQQNTAVTFQNLQINNGTLAGINSPSAVISGSLTWLGGTIAGGWLVANQFQPANNPGFPGLFQISVNGGMRIGSNALGNLVANLISCTLTNSNTATWYGGEISSQFSSFVNDGDFSISGNPSQKMVWNASGDNTNFVNNLLFRQNDVNTFFSPIFENNFSFDLPQGTFEFDGSGSGNGATFTCAPNTVLTFNGGGFSFDSQSSLDSQSEVKFSAGILTIYGSYSATTTTIAGGCLEINGTGDTDFGSLASSAVSGRLPGMLAGTGTFNIHTEFSWTGGNMGGSMTVGRAVVSGTTVVLPGATLVINDASADLLGMNNRTLENYGDIDWQGNSELIGNNSTINNYNTFIVNGDISLVSFPINTFVFNNEGSFIQQSTDVDTFTDLSLVWNNLGDGTITVSAGTLIFGGGGSADTSSLQLAGVVELEFSGSNTTDPFDLSGNLNVDNPLVITGGTVNFQGSVIVPKVEAVGGKANFVDTLTANFLEITGGDVNIYQSGTAVSVELEDGNLGGPGTFTMGTSFLWTGGGMSGTGRTILPSSTNTDIVVGAGSGPMSINGGYSIVNEGSISIAGIGIIGSSGGGSIQNNGNGTITVEGLQESGWIRSQRIDANVAIGAGIAVTNASSNANALTFSPSWPNATLQIAGSFNNSSDVTIPAGNLILGGGGQNTGNIRLNNAGGSNAEGTPITSSSVHFGSSPLSPAFTLGGTLTTSGNALVAFDGGTVNINVALNVSNLVIDGGDAFFNQNAVIGQSIILSAGMLTGNSQVTTTNMTWSGGRMSGGGTTTVSGPFIVPVDGVGTASNRTIDANGVTTFFAGAVIDFQGGVKFTSSQELLVGDGTVVEGLASNPQIGLVGDSLTVTGTMIRTGDSGTTLLALPVKIENQARVNIPDGTLQLAGGLTSTGTWNIALASSLVMTGVYCSYNFNGGQINQVPQPTPPPGPNQRIGDVIVSRAKMVVATGVDLSVARMILSSGTIDGGGALTVTQSLTWVDGGMTGSGTTTILGNLLVVGDVSLSDRLINFGDNNTSCLVQQNVFSRVSANGIQFAACIPEGAGKSDAFSFTNNATTQNLLTALGEASTETQITILQRPAIIRAAMDVAAARFGKTELLNGLKANPRMRNMLVSGVGAPHQANPVNLPVIILNDAAINFFIIAPLPLPNAARALDEGNWRHLIPYYTVNRDAGDRAALYMTQGLSPGAARTAAYFQVSAAVQIGQGGLEAYLGRSLGAEDLGRSLKGWERGLRVAVVGLTVLPYVGPAVSRAGRAATPLLRSIGAMTTRLSPVFQGAARQMANLARLAGRLRASVGNLALSGYRRALGPVTHVSRTYRLGGSAPVFRRVAEIVDSPTSLKQLKDLLGRTKLFDSKKFVLVEATQAQLANAPRNAMGWITETANGVLRDAQGRIIITISPRALTSLRESVITVGHELQHIKDILAGVRSLSETVAETAGVRYLARFEGRLTRLRRIR